jgi:sugar/nucleoside kinase (ribokinase family)
MSLLAVGTLAFDSIQTPFGNRTEALGGSASFLATSASYFSPTRMVGVIGQDFPEEHLDFFKSRNIDISGVERAAGKTFRWHGKYNDNLNVAHTLETHLNVLEDFDPSLPESYKDSSHLVLGNFEPTLQGKVLAQVSNPKFIACDTMNFWIENARDKLVEILSKVHLLSVNDGEARMLSGEYNLVKAAQAIRKMGPKWLIIKRGEHGALLFDDDGIFMAPAYPLEVINDPTGAGDSFAGGLMGFIARSTDITGRTLRQAIITGSVMASFAVEDFSLDRFRQLTQDEIRVRFETFRQLTHFEPDVDFWNG